MLEGKTLMITGGTGTFGEAVLNSILNSKVKEIRIFSRDEFKQDQLRYKYNSIDPKNSQKLKFYIGDIKDINSIQNAVDNVDYIFHAAALKQVLSCESHPIEAVKTNIIGTENVLNIAIESEVKKVICLSTDKASYPINAMGMTKALMEKLSIAKSKTISSNKTKIACVRFGNLLVSRGSVVPLFIKQIKKNKPITITDPQMTRFIMTLKEAVDLIMFAFENACSGDILVRKSPACTINNLMQAICQLFHSSSNSQTIGVRQGEKLSESLLTAEELSTAIDLGKYYRVPSERMNTTNNRNNTLKDSDGFNSNNTQLLTVEEIKRKLLEDLYIQQELKHFFN